MARKRRVSVRKMRAVLRLSELGYSQRKIAKSCSLARSTVGEYQAKARSVGIDCQRAKELSDVELSSLLRAESERLARKAEPDYAQLEKDSKRKGVTLYLLWEEYQAQYAGRPCYSYSQFCRRFRRWRKQQRISMPQEHKAGEKVFVDYAGMRVPIHRRGSDEIAFEAPIFVGALGASSYTFAEAGKGEDLESWLGSHCRMFEFFGGTTEIVVPDNLLSGVKKACYYEPDINPSYRALAEHFGTCVIPTRVRKPKDKAKAESAVQVVEQRILAKLRKRRFHSLAELNAAIAVLLSELNNRQTQRFPESRKTLFEQIERAALKPLPVYPFPLAKQKEATVHIDYHVTFERHHYSVPYELRGQRVQLRISNKSIEILHHGNRVALHLRSNKLWGYTTCSEHMPPSHKAMQEKWTPERFLNWAGKFGPNTVEMTNRILKSKLHQQQAYRSVLGLLRLEKTYGAERLEAACARGVYFGFERRAQVLNILKSKQDMLSLPERSVEQQVLFHDNIRGSNYYQ